MRLVYILCTISIFLFSIDGFAQTLTPKPGFGSGGLALTNLSAEAPNFTYTTARQADGKVIIGGSSLIRLSSNGIVDSSFGTNGLAFKAGFPNVNALAVQPDDKIISVINDFQVLLKRFTASGSPDNTFGTNGTVTIFEANKTFYVHAVKLLQNGKIVVAGSCSIDDKARFFVARFLSNGSPDNTFNGNGKLILDLASYDNVAYDIVEQTTGKLIVAGSLIAGFNETSQLAVIRLNTDGSRDMSFNTTGIQQFTTGSGTGEAAYLVQRYADDKIMIAGTSNGQVLLMRLLADGALDASFSGDGLTTAAGKGLSKAKQLHLGSTGVLVTGQTAQVNSPDWDYAGFKFDAAGNADNSFNGNGQSWLTVATNDINAGSVILNDGSILLAGYNESSYLPNTAKMNSTGIFDLSYGSNGLKYIRVNGTDERIDKILHQADNKIISIGNTSNELGTVNNTVLVRYLSTGGIDNSFGSAGKVTLPQNNFMFHSAILQADQKIILVGDSYAGDPTFENKISLVQLNSNGTIDNGFGVNGQLDLSSAMTNGYGKAVALLSNGNIIVVGKDYEDAQNMVVFRILSNGSLDDSYGTNGRVSLNPGWNESGIGSIGVQPDDKILVGGYEVNINGLSNFFCLRLTATGQLDNSFAGNGIYRTAPSSYEFIEMYSLLLSPDNKIILAGFVVNPSRVAGSASIIKLLNNGSPDNTFNGSGINFYYRALNNDSTYIFPYTMALHPDNSLYVAGDALNLRDEQQPFIIRIKENGQLDNTLTADGTGWYRNSFGGIAATANDLFINSTDNSLYLAGGRTTIGNNADFLIAAFLTTIPGPGITYTFTGNGLWTNAANWQNAQVPPALLPGDATIMISPAPGGSCILNTSQVIAPGGQVIVTTGAQFIIQGNLTTGN
jgi:uncharacterized delta-60 repeat protein